MEHLICLHAIISYSQWDCYHESEFANFFSSSVWQGIPWESPHNFTRKSDFPNHTSQSDFVDKFVLFEVFKCWRFGFYQMKSDLLGFAFYLAQVDASQIPWNILRLHQLVPLSSVPDWPKTLKMLCLVSNMWAEWILVLPMCRSQECSWLCDSHHGNKVLLYLSLMFQNCFYTRARAYTLVDSPLPWTKGELLSTFFSSVLVVFVGQRSSCSDLVFSNKCALWCSALLRDNTAQAGEFSMATNKTQVLLCQATSDYLNKCQPRNQTLERSSSDPQDKGPIDFPH